MNITLNQTTAKHFVSKDKIRPAIQGVYFDCEAKKAVLTNGHILLTVDINPDPGIVSFIAPLAALPKKREAELTFDGSYIRTIEQGQAVTVTEPIKEYYPAWKSIMPEIPDERPGITAIGFAPYLFAGFAAVIKNLGGLALRLDFLSAVNAVKVSPVTPATWEGLIMPTHIPE